MSTVSEIEAAIDRLNPSERAELMERLEERQFLRASSEAMFQNMDAEEIGPEWNRELQKRVQELDEGKAETIESSEVWNRVNERFGTDL